MATWTPRTKELCWVMVSAATIWVQYWLLEHWELTLINRLQFSKIDRFTDWSPAQPIIQTTPMKVQCTYSGRTSGKKTNYIADWFAKILWFFFCIKICWFKDNLAWFWALIVVSTLQSKRITVKSLDIRCTRLVLLDCTPGFASHAVQ